MNRIEVARHGFVPRARFTTTSNEGAVSFDGGPSTTPSGPVTAWMWAFGDGTYGSGAQVAHTYTRSGGYTVTLMIVAPGGRTGSTMRRLPVTVSPSTAHPGNEVFPGDTIYPMEA